MGYEPAELWRFLPLGYVLTVALETPVLWFGLAPCHGVRTRWTASWWLTACTYPIVILVFPVVIEPLWGRRAYVAVAEVFAPAAECLLFWLAFRQPQESQRSAASWARDLAAIVAANLVSFLLGGWLVAALDKS